MKIRTVLAVAAAVAAMATASSAGAVTYVFGVGQDQNGVAANFQWTSNNVVLTAKGYTYAGALSNLTTVSTLPALTSAQLNVQGSSVGVCTSTEGNAECRTLDTTSQIDVLGVSFSAAEGYTFNPAALKLTGATFANVNYTAFQAATARKPATAESGDQLLVFGSNAAGTSAQYLGFNGFIGNFAAGSGATTVSLNGGNATVAFNSPTAPSLEQFFFTLGATGQDVQIASLTFEGGAATLIPPPPIMTDAVAAVPEPATWALMIFGFGAAGSMLRRRRQAVAVRV